MAGDDDLSDAVLRKSCSSPASVCASPSRSTDLELFELRTLDHAIVIQVEVECQLLKTVLEAFVAKLIKFRHHLGVVINDAVAILVPHQESVSGARFHPLGLFLGLDRREVVAAKATTVRIAPVCSDPFTDPFALGIVDLGALSFGRIISPSTSAILSVLSVLPVL